MTENTRKEKRMKAISPIMIMQCYDKRLDLLNFEPQVNNFKEYINMVERAAKDIYRERALNAFLEGRKLTQREIDIATNPNAVF